MTSRRGTGLRRCAATGAVRRFHVQYFGYITVTTKLGHDATPINPHPNPFRVVASEPYQFHHGAETRHLSSLPCLGNIPAFADP